VIASLLLDLSLVAAVVGAVCVIKPLSFLGMSSRGAAALLLAAGLVFAVVIVLWPAPVRRSDGHAAIDRFLADYNFHEFHETRVHATPEAVYRAALDVTPAEIRYLKPLMAIRSLPASLRRRRSTPSGTTPILEIATRGSFFYLAQEPPRELVIGTVGQFWRPDGGRVPGIRGPGEFLAFQDPGFARVVMNFAIEDTGGGWSKLATETRIFAPEGQARLRFSAYWRLIYTGSSLIRAGWLEAIKRRAEAPQRRLKTATSTHP
jgi:hypothetical protein